MTTSDAPDRTEAPEPTAVQLARASALNRFNRWYVYVPLLLVALIGLVLVGLLLFGVLSPAVTGTGEFASGLADLIIIYAAIPLLLLCALPSLAVLALFFQRRSTAAAEGEAPRWGLLRRTLWRVDSAAGLLAQRVNQVAPKVAQPLIRTLAWLAGVTALVRKPLQISTGSEEQNEPDAKRR